MNRIHTFRWLGRDAPHLDAPCVSSSGGVVIGCYGGCAAAGAARNEDGALVWCAADGSWEFAVLLDAHGSAESAALVLAAVEVEAEAVTAALSGPVETALTAWQQLLLARFQSPDFRGRCAQVQGETACLIAARKARFFGWLSVGDCLAYLFHPELACLGQFALNQRSFYEWIGRADTFALTVPCYACGVRELRGGLNRIVMTTDGLLECGSRPFEEPWNLYALFDPEKEGAEARVEDSVRAALGRVQAERGRDSATVIAWECRVGESGLQPSA